ncbi:MAG: GNAT family N-acetyltransferase [Candidatus Electrothrix communis]|nr:MAG: GNAT family N-acetyltransferase [Candidatus Electrothrix communis]
MKIRIANRLDIVAINIIRKEIKEDPADEHQLDDYAEDSITEEEYQVTFVCELNNNTVGYLNLSYHNGNNKNEQTAIMQIFIKETYRGKGLGEKLIIEAKKYCKRTKKFKTIILSVLKSNPAKGLYEKTGFIVSEEKDDGYWMLVNTY